MLLSKHRKPLPKRTTNQECQNNTPPFPPGPDGEPDDRNFPVTKYYRPTYAILTEAEEKSALDTYLWRRGAHLPKTAQFVGDEFSVDNLPKIPSDELVPDLRDGWFFHRRPPQLDERMVKRAYSQLCYPRLYATEVNGRKLKVFVNEWWRLERHIQQRAEDSRFLRDIYLEVDGKTAVFVDRDGNRINGQAEKFYIMLKEQQLKVLDFNNGKEKAKESSASEGLEMM